MGFDFTHYLQANTLACCYFVDADRSPKTLALKTKDFLTHGTVSSMSFMFAWVPLCLPNLMGVALQERKSWGTIHFIVSSKQICSLSCREIFFHPWRLLAANITLRSSPGGQWSGPYILDISSKTYARLMEDSLSQQSLLIPFI